jgi:hypothetical protein
MIRLSFAVLAASVLLAGPVSACPARTAAGDARTIRALEHEWIGSHDRGTLERILADDFRHPVFTGDILTKRQHIDWSVAHPDPPGVHPRFASLDVQLYGATALASGSVEKIGENGQVLSRNLFTDVFVYQACRWQAVSAQETDIRQLPGK